MEIRLEKEKQKIALVAILLAGSCILLYHYHQVLGVGTVFTHLFYIPIILAAFWWKRKGLIVAIFLAAALIVSHYFLRDHVVTANDFLRGFMFVGVGFVAALLTEKIAKEEEELRSTREKLTMLLESLPIVPYTCKADVDFKMTFIGPTVEEITGYKSELFLGEPGFWSERVHLDDRKKVLSELHRVLHESGSPQIEYRFQIADGSYIWVKDIRRFKKNTDGHISHIVGTWQDITAEKKLRRESEYRLQQIIQADKLASLGEMVAGVAHEINNPNSFITYNIPLLEETWELFEPILTNYAGKHPEWRNNNMSIDELCQDMNEIIQAIKTGSDRINKVVTNLKDFVRVDETTDPKPIRINEVIEKTLTIVGAQVRKSIAKVELKLASNLPEIQGNAQKTGAGDSKSGRKRPRSHH